MADNAVESFDYFSPFLAARLLKTDGRAYPLWTRGAGGEEINVAATPKGDGTFLQLKALSFLTQVDVDIPLGGPPTLRATLTPPYLDALKLMDSDLLEITETLLQVQFGYAKGRKGGGAILSPAFEGFLNKPPDVTLGAEVSITIYAQGVHGTFSSETFASGKTFTGTIEEAISELCARQQWVADFTEAKKEDTIAADLGRPAHESQVWRTDLWMLQHLVDRIGCTMRIVTNKDGKGTVEIIPRVQLYAKGKPTHVFTFYSMRSGELGGTEYPLLSAQCRTSAIWLPGVRRLLLQEIDEDKKKNVLKALTDKDSSGNTGPGATADLKGSDQTYPQPGGTDAQPEPIGAHPLPGDPANPSVIDAAKAALDQFKASGMGIHLEVETMGAPTLVPAMCVAVRGLGVRLDTPVYSVHKVTHQIGAGGFYSRALLIANTNPWIAAKEAAAAESPSNQQTDLPQAETGAVANSSAQSGTGSGGARGIQ